MRLTVLLLAAESGAKQERWAKYMRGPKQFVEVQGERLVERTLRLSRSYIDCDIYLLALDDEFSSLPVTRLVPNQFATKAHSVLGALDAWGFGELIILYSDVYYSEKAFSTLMNTPGTHFFGRSGRSAFTFKNYGELFAVRVAQEDKACFVEVLRQSVRNYTLTGQQSFWVVYRLMAGLPIDKHLVENELFVEVHDETDDVDFPQDVNRLVDAVEKRPGWRVRFIARRLSLWNKRRRDRFRERLGRLK